MLTSDPWNWLRPIYARVRALGTFPLLSPHHQFGLLVDAVELENASKAASMREYNTATQHAMLGYLADCYLIGQMHQSEDLWTVRKGDRHLVCNAKYLVSGIDVRLLEGLDFRRTQLCKDAPTARALADGWKAKLLEAGWSDVTPNR